MSGNPYVLNSATPQLGYFEIDGENFEYVNSVTIFEKDFPYQATDKDNDIFLKWDEWSKNILERSERVQRLAKKYNAVFVPLFNEFADLGKNYGCGCWTVDCIHPTPAGHEFIARQWLNACKSILN